MCLSMCVNTVQACKLDAMQGDILMRPYAAVFVDVFKLARGLLR